jgi:hypothetical protein
MEFIAVIAVVILFGVWALVPSVKAIKPKKKAKPSEVCGAGSILADGRIRHRGKIITLAEAKKLKLTLEFEQERKEYKPIAWR